MGAHGQNIHKSPNSFSKLCWQQKPLSHKAQAALFVPVYVILLNTYA